MNKHDIDEIREFLMQKLNTLRNGSYPNEVKIYEKLLVMTTEKLETQNSSSASKTISGNDLCKCGHTRDVHTYVGCDSIDHPDCFCSRFKSKANSEENN